MMSVSADSASAAFDTSLGEIRIDTPDGPMRCIVARPETGRPVDAAIMYPHVGGLTDTMRTMAARAAAAGFICIVPDVYHRLGTIVLDPQSTDEEAVAILRIAAGSVTPEGVAIDGGAVLDWLDGQEFARRGKRGTIGYGRGGSFALAAAGIFPERVGAAASVLGFGFTGEGKFSVPGNIARADAGIYCAFAEDDDIIPPNVPGELDELLRRAGAKYELVVHAGARHPYAFPDRTVYDRAFAEYDWLRIGELFERSLP